MVSAVSPLWLTRMAPAALGQRRVAVAQLAGDVASTGSRASSSIQ
jgi:hypothetical protein